VSYDDDDAPGRIDGRLGACVLLPPHAENFQLGADFFAQVLILKRMTAIPFRASPRKQRDCQRPASVATVDGP
jgi:hypothetical protein